MNWNDVVIKNCESPLPALSTHYTIKTKKMILRPLGRHLPKSVNYKLLNLTINPISSHNNRWPSLIRNQTTSAASGLSSYLPSFTFANQMFEDLSRSTAVAKVIYFRRLNIMTDLLTKLFYTTVAASFGECPRNNTFTVVDHDHSYNCRLTSGHYIASGSLSSELIMRSYVNN